MIDIHSHILPGVDDGASSIKESLHMLSMARRQGITDVFATSHYSKAFPNRDPEKLRRLRDELMSRANRPVQGPEGRVKCKRPIRIWTGQEIFYSNSVIRLLEEGKLLTLADSNYVLVEFMPSVPYSEICTAVRNLSRAGYTPVVAHAERYRCLRKGKRVEELIDLDALIQMNYRSVSGGWHDATARWCKDNLKKRNIHFMGTDMHNIGSRMPDTKEAMGWMRKHLDSTYLRQITRENALRITENKIIK